MSNILIVGNVYKDVYLRLDERHNHFERGINSDWLDLQFNGSAYPFFRRTSIYSGAAVALEVCSQFDIDAHVSGNDLRMKQGQIMHHGAPDSYRYLLCRENASAILPSSQQTPTKWQAPEQRADWILVDRSAVLTPHLVQEIQQYLKTNTSTRLVVCANKYFPKIGEPLLEYASLIFTDDTYLLPPNTRKQVYIINDHSIRFGEYIQAWHSKQLSLTTRATAYSIITTTIFATFLQGCSPQKSLQFAKINVENTTLGGSLSQRHITAIHQKNQLGKVNLRMLAASLFTPGKGILAADESVQTIGKRFAEYKIANTVENRRDYRNLLFTTPKIEKYLSGVILNEETIHQQTDDGQDFVSYLVGRGLIPGIKADQGLVQFPNSNETYTKGLEGLADRLNDYYIQGIRFAKWRAAFQLSEITPTILAVEKNCDLLARYAKICQHANLVPIVEPEILYDGDYTIEQCAQTTKRILKCLLDRMKLIGVDLKACIIKCNMVMAGKDSEQLSEPSEVGKATANVLRHCLPAELTGVAFLSGGQTPEQATANLGAVVKQGPYPWRVTFSFARALQEPVLAAWRNDTKNTPVAQDVFLKRLAENSTQI